MDHDVSSPAPESVKTPDIKTEAPPPTFTANDLLPLRYRPELFPEGPPQPMPSLDQTSIDPIFYQHCGLVGDKGYPQLLIRSPQTLRPVTEATPAYQRFIDHAAEANVSPAVVEAARQSLENLGLFGHSFRTTILEGKTIQGKDRASGFYNVVRFGLWPRKMPDGDFYPTVWAGDFYKSRTGQNAGDNFEGWAVVYDRSSASYTKLPSLGSEFVPPTNLYFIVPDEETKTNLATQIKEDTTLKPERSRLASKIFTLQEVADGELESAIKAKQQEQ